MEGGRQAEVAKAILSAKNVPYVVAAPLLIQVPHRPPADPACVDAWARVSLPWYCHSSVCLHGRRSPARPGATPPPWKMLVLEAQARMVRIRV